MPMQTKKPSAATPVVAEEPKEVLERLAGLLPGRRELEKALQGVAPDQIHGPGRPRRPARWAGDRDGARCRAF